MELMVDRLVEGVNLKLQVRYKGHIYSVYAYIRDARYGNRCLIKMKDGCRELAANEVEILGQEKEA